MKRNAEIGLFTKPSVLLLAQMIGVAKTDKSCYLVKQLHAGKSIVIFGKNEFGQHLVNIWSTTA